MRATLLAIFALSLAGIGIGGLIDADFAPLWQPVPLALASLPGLVSLGDLIVFVVAVCLLWPRTAPAAANLLFAMFAAWLLLVKIPIVLRAPGFEMNYQSGGETAVLVAALWSIVADSSADRSHGRLSWLSGELGARLARTLFALALLAFGLAHFLYRDLTASLVPSWLPTPRAWVYVTGAAYLAAGLALLGGVLARVAAWLVAVQMAMLTVLVWGPALLTGSANAVDLNEAALSWTLTVAAFVLADRAGSVYPGP